MEEEQKIEGYEPVMPEDRSFDDLLLTAVEQDKVNLVRSLLRQFREGEPSAIKVVTNAILKGSISEEERMPISDDRFKEIIEFAADRIRESRLEQFRSKEVTTGERASE